MQVPYSTSEKNVKKTTASAYIIVLMIKDAHVKNKYFQSNWVHRIALETRNVSKL